MILIVYAGSALSGITTNFEKIKEIAENKSAAEMKLIFEFEIFDNIYEILTLKGKLTSLPEIPETMKGREIKLII